MCQLLWCCRALGLGRYRRRTGHSVDGRGIWYTNFVVSDCTLAGLSSPFVVSWSLLYGFRTSILKCGLDTFDRGCPSCKAYHPMRFAGISRARQSYSCLYLSCNFFRLTSKLSWSDELLAWIISGICCCKAFGIKGRSLFVSACSNGDPEGGFQVPCWMERCCYNDTSSWYKHKWVVAGTRPSPVFDRQYSISAVWQLSWYISQFANWLADDMQSWSYVLLLLNHIWWQRVCWQSRNHFWSVCGLVCQRC